MLIVSTCFVFVLFFLQVRRFTFDEERHDMALLHGGLCGYGDTNCRIHEAPKFGYQQAPPKFLAGVVHMRGTWEATSVTL